MKQAVFGITGWKNSGKTTLTERLIRELTRRGWKVSSIKHAHHDFDIDHKGTDSFRHRTAGASEVAIVSDRRWAVMHELRGEEEPTLDAILSRLEPCDLVLVEGYKLERHPKIEMRRAGALEHTPIGKGDPTVLAVASDGPQPGEALPVYDLDDIAGIADFVQRTVGLR